MAVVLSSLLIVAGDSADVDAYRAVRQSLALAFALLGLEEAFTLSAFHPRDTYELRTDPEDGVRYWEVTLPHPLMHIVKSVRCVGKASSQGSPPQSSGSSLCSQSPKWLTTLCKRGVVGRLALQV